MFKVVIIDDEQIIVEGLKHMMPWEKYECVIVGTASDGVEGAKMIREIKPDIVFTDIHMPNLDGLSMIAGIRSEIPDVQITVITGYRDFEFAQRAISLGVARYVTKPTKMNELEEALEFMCAKLNNINKTTERKVNENTEQPDEHVNSFVVKSALKYMEEHYSEKLSLTDVAEKTYVSQWHLSKLLNKQTGQSFSDILSGIRISIAKELLLDPSLKIYEVSERVGFLDVAHFSKIFKKVEGISANEYRNKRLA